MSGVYLERKEPRNKENINIGKIEGNILVGNSLKDSIITTTSEKTPDKLKSRTNATSSIGRLLHKLSKKRPAFHSYFVLSIPFFAQGVWLFIKNSKSALHSVWSWWDSTIKVYIF